MSYDYRYWYAAAFLALALAFWGCSSESPSGPDRSLLDAVRAELDRTEREGGNR